MRDTSFRESKYDESRWKRTLFLATIKKKEKKRSEAAVRQALRQRDTSLHVLYWKRQS